MWRASAPNYRVGRPLSYAPVFNQHHWAPSQLKVRVERGLVWWVSGYRGLYTTIVEVSGPRDFFSGFAPRLSTRFVLWVRLPMPLETNGRTDGPM